MSTAGPLARVTLPDGQTLDAAVLQRYRDPYGTWWYRVELTLWTLRTAPHEPGRIEPEPTTLWVDAAHIQPIPGQVYKLGRPEPERTWIVTRKRSPAGFVQTVHGEQCWLPKGNEEHIDTAEAGHLLNTGAAQPCDKCAPQRILRTLGRLQARQRLLLDPALPCRELLLGTVTADPSGARVGVMQRAAAHPTPNHRQCRVRRYRLAVSDGAQSPAPRPRRSLPGACGPPASTFRQQQPARSRSPR
jgi:hypothetical protein